VVLVDRVYDYSVSPYDDGYLLYRINCGFCNKITTLQNE
jgi:hypothetical protein